MRKGFKAKFSDKSMSLPFGYAWKMNGRWYGLQAKCKCLDQEMMFVPLPLPHPGYGGRFVSCRPTVDCEKSGGQWPCQAVYTYEN